MLCQKNAMLLYTFSVDILIRTIDRNSYELYLLSTINVYYILVSEM